MWRLGGVSCLLLFCAPVSGGAQVAEGTLGATIERLSEPGGYFDTDNLISNEAAYLHVIGGLARQGVRGGAYIGVGPEQNFSYIAQIRPEIAYLIDIRRDNLLLHLMFKAIFAEADSRLEYLALLFGRPPPPSDTGWSLERLLAWIDSMPTTTASQERAARLVLHGVTRFGVRLSAADTDHIARFHREFMRQGLALRFSSTGRRPRAYYPTYRQLTLERDRAGNRASFLADDSRYDYLREMQRRNRIIPVVGDLAGSHALAAIGEDIRRRGLRVSAMYVSNVEFYLFGGRGFERYAETVRGLPRDRRSVIIRSWFQRGWEHPHAVPGYLNTQLLQTMDDFAEGSAGGYTTYWDLVTDRPIPPA